MTASLGTAALQYAARGWYVFPLRPHSKIPLGGSNGFRDATTDPATIAEWWEKNPEANIGVDCGRSGLVVLDVDVKNGAKGAESFTELLGEYGLEIAETLIATTPSGGRHYFYRGETASGTNVFGPGIDVRSKGGYIVAAPSEIDGASYTWVRTSEEKQTIAEFPAAMLPKERPRVAVTEDSPIITGARNSTLASIAGRMRHGGHSQNEILAALRACNADRCRPPLPDNEVENIARSIANYEPKHQIGDTARPASADRDAVPQAMTSETFLRGDDDVPSLVEGLIPEAGSALLGAKKKVGKSVFLLNLALCVARGEPFLGRRTKQGSVLYLSIDESRAITQERASVLGVTASDPIIWVTSRTRPDAWEPWLRGLVKEHAPVVLIADTLVKLAGITKIEDYGQWNAAYKPLYGIAEDFRCAFVVSAHNRKAGVMDPDAVAGSTAATGGVDTIIILERDAKNRRTIMTEQRQGEDMEKRILSLDQDTGRLSIGPEHWLEQQREVEQRVLDVLGTEWLKRDEIISRAKRRALAVKRAVGSLVDAGLLERRGRGVRGDDIFYRQRVGPTGTKNGPSGTDVDQPGPRNGDPHKPHIKNGTKKRENVVAPRFIPGPESALFIGDQPGPRNGNTAEIDDSWSESQDQEWTNRDQPGPRNVETAVTEW